MANNFTNPAKVRWESISKEFQEKILSNVWCSSCLKATTIINFSGRINKGDLILTGQCIVCSKKVARLIEGE